MNLATWNKRKKIAQVLTVIFLVVCAYSVLKMANGNSNAKSENAGYIIGYLMGSNLLIPLSLLLAIIYWFMVLFAKPKLNTATLDDDIITEVVHKKEPLSSEQKTRLEYLLAKTSSDDTLSDEEFEELQSLSD